MLISYQHLVICHSFIFLPGCEILVVADLLCAVLVATQVYTLLDITL